MPQQEKKKTIRTRIAPSPTGDDLHIGNVYTGLINWAFAKKHNGQFIIRIEDTDRERYIAGAEEKILSSLRSFHLTYDEGPDIGGPYSPYRQSERLPIYKEYIQKLIEKGNAYYCFCTKERLETMRKEQASKKKQQKYDRYCLQNVHNAKERIAEGEKHVIRLKVPDKQTITFTDLIRGEIIISSEELDDQVLMKSDGYPTYHFGVVVDDYLMKISHVIRAEEWISSTPKHVILYHAFGWPLPIFAHVPILRNTDRSKLSKRKNPVWATWYIKEGYLPEAVLNYLALLGWGHPEEKEIFSLDEFVRLFDLKDINPAGPIFDLTKLNWINGEYIRAMSVEALYERVKAYLQTKDVAFVKRYEKLDEDTLKRILTLAQSRMAILKDFFQLTKYLVKPADYAINSEEQIIAKDLEQKFQLIEIWNKDTIFAILKEALKKYNIRMPVLYKLFTGEEKGLPLPESLEILGKDEVLKRLQALCV